MTIHRVFIVEDEQNTRNLLSLVITEHPKLVLAVAVGNLADARKSLQMHVDIDVFLVDLGLPDGNGIDFIRDIRKHDPLVAIMVLSVFGDERHVVDAIEHGAGGYIHKDEPMEEVGRHIEQVLHGDSPISPSIAKHILNRMQATQTLETPTPPEILTQREMDVLNILSRGFKRTEVAEHLNISPHTITSHIKNIYHKLGVHSRSEAIFEAYHLGLIKLHD